MKLKVKNLGPIQNAEISLNKRFYTFVGYNNSGKSYLAQLMWALMNKELVESYSNYAKSKTYINLTSLETLLFKSADKAVTFKLEDPIVKEITSNFCSYISTELLPNLFNVPTDHPSIKNTILEIVTSSKNNHAFSKAFATSRATEKVLFENNTRTIYSMSLYKRENDNKINLAINDLQLGEPFVDKNYVKKIEESISRGASLQYPDNNEILGFVSDYLIKFILQTGQFESFYLPSTRIYHPTFYQYIYKYEKENKEHLSKNIVQEIGFNNFSSENIKNIVNKHKTPSTKAMDQLGDLLFSLAKSPHPTKHSAHISLLKDLQKILDGNIDIKSALGISPVDLSYKLKTEETLDMYMSSSMVNQLATLYLYWKYWCKDANNFLVIDEPEVNLHPKLQKEIVELLIKFASIENNKVLITTHSPLITKVLNNYINLGQLKNNQTSLNNLLERIHSPIPKDNIMDKHEYGIYFFSGSEVIEYGIEDYGVHFADFASEFNEVERINELITDEIYEIKEATAL